MVPQTWFAWRNVIHVLAQRFKMNAPDLRGCGASGKPLEGYEKENVASDVRTLVHSVGNRKISLVGHDIGAQAAYPYAAQWPDEVRASAYIDGMIP